MAANALPPHWYHRRRVAVRQRYPAIKHLQLDGSFLLIFPMIDPKLIYETDPRLNGKISNKETSTMNRENFLARNFYLPTVTSPTRLYKITRISLCFND